MEPQEKFIYLPPGMFCEHACTEWFLKCICLLTAMTHVLSFSFSLMLAGCDADDKYMRVWFFTGIIPIMWVELVLSVLMIGLGVCLVVGINYVCNNLLVQLLCDWSYFGSYFVISLFIVQCIARAVQVDVCCDVCWYAMLSSWQSHRDWKFIWWM